MTNSYSRAERLCRAVTTYARRLGAAPLAVITGAVAAAVFLAATVAAPELVQRPAREAVASPDKVLSLTESKVRDSGEVADNKKVAGAGDDRVAKAVGETRGTGLHEAGQDSAGSVEVAMLDRESKVESDGNGKREGGSDESSSSGNQGHEDDDGDNEDQPRVEPQPEDEGKNEDDDFEQADEDETDYSGDDGGSDYSSDDYSDDYSGDYSSDDSDSDD